MKTLNNILFVISLFMVCIAFYKHYLAYTGEILSIKSNRKKQKLKEIGIFPWFEFSENAEYVLLIAAIVIGIWVRIWLFGTIPFGINQDEAMAAVDAKALADYGTDRFGMVYPIHFTAWVYSQMNVMMSYLMIPFIKIGGLTPTIARLPSLLVGTVGLVFLYLFTKDIAGKTPALIVLLAAAANPWHIMQCRWALEANIFPHFFLIGVFLLNRGIKKPILMYISMFFFAMCMYCYGISFYTVPLFLLAAGIYLIIKKLVSQKDFFICMAIYLVFAWPIFAFILINYLKLDTIYLPFMTIPYFPESVRAKDLLFFSDKAQLVTNLKALLNVVFLQKKDLPWNSIENFGPLYLCSMPFVLCGLYFAAREFKKKNSGYFLLLLFFATGIWAGIITNNVNINRINIIFYPVLIFMALGLYYTFAWVKSTKWIALGTYAILFVLFASTYFTSYAQSTKNYFFYDFERALEYVENVDCDKLYITADTQYTGASAVSEILTMFCHNIDAKYFQGTDGSANPYKERYIFKSIKNITVDPNENAAYVIKQSDKAQFDENIFNITSFNDYCVAVKKG
ncbi:MAG: glycosyltransferase family 39 protein [Clostridia bacterium]|nr:glycosyltransferase family 39 protein [Clostridia bacterium]